jgi:biopolymer transport protein ExbD
MTANQKTPANPKPPVDDHEEVAEYKRRKKRHSTSMSNPPLVPLIDVFLFLIIFFLLSCQFHQSEGTIPANLPSSLSGLNDGSGTFKGEPIRVTLKPNPGDAQSVIIEIRDTGKKPSNMVELFTYLAGQRARYGGEQTEIPVVIKPLQGVRWGFVVDAFNQAVRAGFKEVGVAPSGA